MTDKLTPFQQELMEAAEEWADKAYDRKYVIEERNAFRALVARALSIEEVDQAADWKILCDIARKKTGMK